MTSRSKLSLACALLGATALTLAASAVPAAEPADVIIAGGTVYTGEDKPATTADVVIAGDKVVYVGPNAAARYTAKETYAAKGMIVSPGFIDGHSHPERWLNSADPKMRNVLPWLTQGETLLIIGVEGAGPVDIAAQKAKFESAGIGINVLPLVGYDLLRPDIVGEGDRPATPEEMTRAKADIKKGMCMGGWGLSATLFNAPNSYATTEEVIDLAKETGKYGGFFHNHQRDEASYGIGVIASTAESIRIGREGHLPVLISHIKAIGPDVWGKSTEMVAMISKARAEGVDVWADQYPWPAASAGIAGMVIPIWALEGGRDKMLARFKDPATLEKIRTEGTENIRRRGGPESLQMVAIGFPWTGKTIGEMGKIWGVTPVDAVIRMVSESEAGGGVASFSLNEKDIVTFMKAPWMTSSSDAGANHPRLYSSYPRKFQKYAVEDKVITVQEFIRQSTGRMADQLKLDRRGYLRPGYFADVVVFNPQTFKQKNDFVKFDIPSEGVERLFVNGKLAVKDSHVTGVLAGQAVLHKPTPGSCS